MRRSDITEVLSGPNRLLDEQGKPAAAPAMITRDEAQALMQRVVAMSKADGIDVQIGTNYTTNVRFADNQMSTAGAVTDFAVAVQSWFGKKHAVVQTNEISDAALRSAVDKSERLAKLAPDDPEAMPMLGAQQLRTAEAYFASVAGISAEDRARLALTALEPARGASDLRAAGFLINTTGATALGNNKGLFAYHRSTNTNFTLTVRTTDGTGSGWAGAEHNDA